MALSAERLAYKAAIAAKDWDGAIQIINDNPTIFGTPPAGVPKELAAIASDPMEPGWMVMEWSAQKNECPPGQSGCRPYLLRAHQFDHIAASATSEEVAAWFDEYVASRQTHAPAMHQLGQTLYLLKVEQIVQITDFDGVKL